METSQHLCDDMRRQRGQALVVNQENSVVDNPLRVGVVFPNWNNAPCQGNFARTRVPWFNPPARREGLRPVPSDMTSPDIFDGDCRQCPFCISDCAAGGRMVRLRCRHMIHSACSEGRWVSYNPSRLLMQSAERLYPNCRGPGPIIAVWPYIAPKKAETTMLKLAFQCRQ